MRIPVPWLVYRGASHRGIIHSDMGGENKRERWEIGLLAGASGGCLRHKLSSEKSAASRIQRSLLRQVWWWPKKCTRFFWLVTGHVRQALDHKSTRRNKSNDQNTPTPLILGPQQMNRQSSPNARPLNLSEARGLPLGAELGHEAGGRSRTPSRKSNSWVKWSRSRNFCGFT